MNVDTIALTVSFMRLNDSTAVVQSVPDLYRTDNAVLANAGVYHRGMLMDADFMASNLHVLSKFRVDDRYRCIRLMIQQGKYEIFDNAEVIVKNMYMLDMVDGGFLARCLGTLLENGLDEHFGRWFITDHICKTQDYPWLEGFISHEIYDVFFMVRYHLTGRDEAIDEWDDKRLELFMKHARVNQVVCESLQGFAEYNHLKEVIDELDEIRFDPDDDFGIDCMNAENLYYDKNDEDEYDDDDDDEYDDDEYDEDEYDDDEYE